MNDLAIIRLREIGQLDQIEAMLLSMLDAATLASDRRALNLRLNRVRRLQVVWQPKGGTIDAIHERKRHQ